MQKKVSKLKLRLESSDYFDPYRSIETAGTNKSCRAVLVEQSHDSGPK
jgi:hypothetical protein